MLLRLAAALALATVLACQPSIENEPPPTPPGGSSPAVDFAVFDPTASPPAIPLPNDLALQPSSIATQGGAQAELLRAFAAAGGFPNDQETPIAIDFRRENVDASTAKITLSAPDLDLTTFGATTLAVIAVSPAGVPEDGQIDPPQAADYVKLTDRGTLTLHHKADPATGSRRWKPGFQYIVAVRGGASGVKTVGGGNVNPQPVTYLITRGVDLTLPENEGLIPGDTRTQKEASAAQLEKLRQSYASAFAAVGGVAKIPVAELAIIQTFKIAPASEGVAVVTDASAGVVPLPSDLLLDPTTDRVVNNPAFGRLAEGIATLDGFSTTAMILSQTAAPIVVETVTKDTVFLYDLSNPAQPARVKEVNEGAGAGFVAEPLVLGETAAGAACATAAGCFSTAIGLQPAVLVSESPLRTLPPLKEGTEYAVLVTDGVLAAPTTPTGSPTPLQRSTLSNILLFDSPLADGNGKSLLAGQPDATAAGLEKIRLGAAAAAAALQAEKGIAKSHVVLGYTFRTQTITATALELAAAPYASPTAFVPGMPVNVTAAFAAVPLTGVQEILSVPIPTLNPIDVQTGALEPDNTKWTPATLNAFVVVPAARASAPLVVFQHGFGQSKSDVGAIASALAQAGFVVAAIDAPLHGERSYCTQDPDCVCPPGSATCTAGKCGFFGPAGLQGDAMQIGSCTNGSAPVAGVSGKFFVTGNFFRTRDAIRQDILDSSALILALAPLSVPVNQLAAELASKGVMIDPTKVYWVGQSLGGILGTLNTAANPRISRAVLNVPGATVVDVFTSSPELSAQVAALLAGLTPPIVAGTPEYLEFIQVAKLVLDGGEPVNFARHLTGDAAHPTLANLLATPPTSQDAKSVFGQFAVCDQVIPNPFNLFLFDQIGLTQNTAPNAFVQYTVAGSGSPGSCVTSDNPAHGFLLNAIDATATGAGQGDAAAYLLDLTAPTANRP